MSNKNWVCIACARSFTRKYSAQRHVKHLQGSHSAIVTKDEYEIGIRTGALLPPPRRPTYVKLDVGFLDTCKQKLKEKLANIIADDVLRDPQSRKILTVMFLAEHNQAQSKDSDEFSKWVSRRMGQS